MTYELERLFVYLTVVHDNLYLTGQVYLSMYYKTKTVTIVNSDSLSNTIKLKLPYTVDRFKLLK